MSQQINLYNPAFHKQPSHFTLPLMLQGLAVVLLGGLLLYAYVAYQISAIENQLTVSMHRLSDEQDRLAHQSAGYSPKQKTEQLQNELEQLEKKADEARLLAETLSRGAVGTGYSEYLRAFSRQVVPGLWLTRFKITATEVSLSGGALSPELLPAYIQNLGREEVMQGKRFSNLQMQPAKEGGYLEFTLYSTPEEEVKP